ncbi:hypothetical protein V5O48_018664 [Marasmius crinis-equi]|uniref:TEA domain-containing protein n=1 Tax=Marasmius crinis-equi TaxID=585013 RepID=A0ABR3EKM4_9AGAR
MSPPKSTLTPQRKHRKLLKDGSGSEVWPESVEAVFVDGLKSYWDSPWATYSGGRSRWRNQFLVEYLQGQGITRSKKQVASHLQVLRNMWKGEPEYQLVAGADEHVSSESSSSTPNSLLSTSLPSSPASNSPTTELPTPTTNPRATSLTISAQHMTPFHVKIDGLLPPPPGTDVPVPAAVIKLRLTIPPSTSPALPALHGFGGAVSFSSTASTITRCLTKLYIDGAKQNQRADPLIKSENDEMLLPDSDLGSCRWLDEGTRIGITQEISLDGHPVLYLIYEFDRKTDFPSAQIVKYQRYPAVCDRTRSRSPQTQTQTQPQQPQYYALYTTTPNYTWNSSPTGVEAPLFQLGTGSGTEYNSSSFYNNNTYDVSVSASASTYQMPQQHLHQHHQQQLHQMSMSPPAIHVPPLSVYNYS